MVKKKKNKKRKINNCVDFQDISHQHNFISGIKQCQEKIDEFYCSIGLKPVHVSKLSIINYQNMRKEILLLSEKYPEIWLIYDRLPRKIFRYNETLFHAIYISIFIIIFTLNFVFSFFEFGIGAISRFDTEVDVIYVLIIILQIPLYIQIRKFYYRKIENVLGLLSDLKDMINDRKKMKQSNKIDH